MANPILQRAALPMPTVVQALDALHLASALLFQERAGGSPAIAAHGLQQAASARALGFKIIGF